MSGGEYKEDGKLRFLWRAMDHKVICVLSLRPDGYCVYLGAVPGQRHDDEWIEVARSGTKHTAKLGRAIAIHYWPEIIAAFERDGKGYAK